VVPYRHLASGQKGLDAHSPAAALLQLMGLGVLPIVIATKNGPNPTGLTPPQKGRVVHAWMLIAIGCEQ